MQRIRNAKRELTENGLKFTDKQGNPIFVTDDTVQIAEKQVDDYRKKQVNAVKTERQKLIRQQKSQKIIQEKAKKYDETVQFIQNKTGEKVGGQTTLIKWVGRTLNRVKNALDSANKAENERNKFAEAFRDIYGALKHGFNEITPKRFLDGFRTGDSAKKFAKMVYIEQNGHYWNEPKRETQVQSRVQSRQQPNYQKQKDDGFGFGD